MKVFIIILVMVTLQNMAKADSKLSTISTNGLTDIETQTIDQATNLEIKSLSICMNDEGETEVSNTACINEVFGDIY